MILLAVAALLIGFVLFIAYMSYRIAFLAPKRSLSHVPSIPQGGQYDEYHEVIDRCVKEMLGRPCEEVTITAFDGLKLFARYYHVAEGAPLQILFHGYKSGPFTDFCGGSKLAMELGYNVLVVDQRSHGRSEGKTITFGVYERKDCVSWIHYALERFGKDTKIVLVGISMGAATVLMVADQDLPENVVGIMADCPYSSPKEIIKEVAHQMGFPPNLMYPFVKLGAKVYGGFNLEEISAVEAVTKTKLPILLIHGEADDFVPCHMSHAIKKAGGEIIEIHTFPGASHGMSYMVDAKRYEEVTIAFLKRIMQ